MNITMTSYVPKEWVGKKPVETYETRFLYTGFSRYNTEKKTLSLIARSPSGITYTETPCDATVFPRAYSTESARITVYSVSPKVWKEEVGLTDTHFFVQQPIQTAST